MRRGLRWCALLGIVGCGPKTSSPAGLPDKLPFELARAETGGAPLNPAAVPAFTQKLSGFLKSVDYFNWVARISHGVDASTGKPDYALWWQDVDAVKAGDKITFQHSTSGGGHNIFIPSGQVLTAAAGGYLLSGDPAMGRVVEKYAEGFAAACAGFVYDQNDPNIWLIARNFVAQNHDYSIDGRKAAVDFSMWFSAYAAWNAQREHFPNNPSWGDVWVTNMRSKDDVPHMFVAAEMLRYVAERGKDATVRAAAKAGDDCIRGFTKDIVDSGYKIRTKDAMGQPFVPDMDLASFVYFDSLVPNGECAAKLSSALLGYGDPRDNDCMLNDNGAYEAFAVGVHYYNYPIIQVFHLSAITAALMTHHDEVAHALLTGLILRVRRYEDLSNDEPGRSDPHWNADQAVFLLRSAAAGLPLTADEVRLIHTQYGAAIDAYQSFPRWDLWASSVPDGVYHPDGGYLPSDTGSLVGIEQLALGLGYCGSPFKNPAGEAPIDCAQLGDPGRW